MSNNSGELKIKIICNMCEAFSKAHTAPRFMQLYEEALTLLDRGLLDENILDEVVMQYEGHYHELFFDENNSRMLSRTTPQQPR